MLVRLRTLRKKPVDPSRALTSNLVVPCPPGLAYDPYQIAGIEYAVRTGQTLNGDDPGSGKTIQAIGYCNYFPAVKRVLIICPGFLKPHWQREFLKWDVKGLSVGVAHGMKGVFPATNVVVINYEILKAYREQLRAGQWDVMIVDEVHKLKSKKADRTREVWGGIKRDEKKRIIERVSPIPCARQLALTGTPTLNGKPKELWNMAQALDPTGLGRDWFTFARRYCKLQELTRFNPAKGVEEHSGWIWDQADNLDELQRIMRERFMVRRLKSEIMPQLPPKRRMIVPITMDKTIKKILGAEGLDYETKVREIALKDQDEFEEIGFGEFSKAMLNVGLAMIEPTREVLDHDLLEHKKIVVMCYHKEVAEQIQGGLTNRLLIHGDVPPMKRQAIVDRFREDDTINVLVCTIGAGGVGYTMLPCALMIFPERTWVPGDVTQAEDRIHRRGQFEQAMYKHLVLEGGQSERQVKVLIEKQDRSDSMLDKQEA